MLGFAFAGPLVKLFRDDPPGHRIRNHRSALPCVPFALMGLVTMTNMLYQNIGRWPGATAAVARQGALLFIPVVLVLPRVFEVLSGVYLAQPQ